MTAKVITIANQKGGAGKTTLAMQLAGTIGRRGRRVLVVDADPQATATRWAAAAADDAPFPATVSGLAAAGEKVHREIRKFIEDYDVIVVDCPPAVDSPVPQSALLVSDLALVPIIPSPADLWAARGIRQLIANISDVNEALDAMIVPNMLQPNVRLGQTALDQLGEFGLRLTRHRLSLRTAYRESALFGCTVHSLGPRAKVAIDEVDGLVDEVLAALAAGRLAHA